MGKQLIYRFSHGNFKLKEWKSGDLGTPQKLAGVAFLKHEALTLIAYRLSLIYTLTSFLS